MPNTYSCYSKFQKASSPRVREYSVAEGDTCATDQYPDSNLGDINAREIYSIYAF